MIENDLCGLLCNFGLKVGIVGVMKFEECIWEFVDDMFDIWEIMELLLVVW